MSKKIGKLNANKPIGEGLDCREHGTKWKAGARGVLTPDAVREFAALGMSIPAIGYFLGCTKQNIYGALKEDEALNQAWCEGVAELLYKAGQCISRKIDNDDTVASLFTLKCKHIPGETGWIEEQYKKEQPTTDFPRVNIYIPSNNRDLPEIE